MALRIASAVLAAILSVPSAVAEEVTIDQHPEVTAGAFQPRWSGMVRSLPPSWQAGDGGAMNLDLAADDGVGSLQALWPAAGEPTGPADAVRTAFQVEGAAGMLEMPPGAAGRRLPVVLVLHDSLGLDGRSDAYAAQMLGAGIAVLDLADADLDGVGAALDALALDPRLDVGRIGVVGFGAGARLAAILPFPFEAHALLYPGCGDLGGPPSRGREVLLMHGGADPVNTAEGCGRVAQRFEAAGLIMHRRIFDGASYAWDYPHHGLEAPTSLPAAGSEGRVRVRPWPALVALSAAELAGFFARALRAGAQ